MLQSTGEWSTRLATLFEEAIVQVLTA